MFELFLKFNFASKEILYFIIDACIHHLQRLGWHVQKFGPVFWTKDSRIRDLGLKEMLGGARGFSDNDHHILVKSIGIIPTYLNERSEARVFRPILFPFYSKLLFGSFEYWQNSQQITRNTSHLTWFLCGIDKYFYLS